ncbi:MAG: CBS domain-containing protein [Actinobacteria bacterium]|nr:MAG: CBS domain-containing protein [Actinomycetota bacterium]
MTVREALVSDPRVVQAGAPAREAAELLTHPNVRSALVVDGHRLVGSITPESIVAAVSRGVDLTAATAADLAQHGVPTIDPNAHIDEALLLMGEHDLERLPVVEDGRLLGVLLREPLLRRLAEDEAPGDPEVQQQT